MKPYAVSRGPRADDTLAELESAYLSMPQREALPARVVAIFFDPNCDPCNDLLRAVATLARELDETEAILLATDSPYSEAKDHLATYGLDGQPMVAVPGILERTGIPGTPYALLMDDSFRVASPGGGVNTLEQLELLLDGGSENLSNQGAPEDTDHGSGHMDEPLAAGRASG